MVSLVKGQAISLAKTAGATLTRIAMGTGWDGVAKKSFFGFGGGGGDIDLDASVLLYSGRQRVDEVWFRQLQSKDGSIVHSGDNRTGDGDGDDETINVDLEKLPASVDALVFVVNSFSQQTFASVKNAYTRLIDLQTGKEIARYSLSDQGDHTGLIMATLKRKGGDWELTAIGERAAGRTFHEMSGQIERHV